MKKTIEVAKLGILFCLLLSFEAVSARRSPPGQSFSAKPDQPGNSCHGAPLVITRATLWTAEGLVENSEVVFASGRVAAVGKSGAVARPPGAQVIDAGGDTLLPGLIDAHAHLVFPGGAPKEIRDDPRRPEFSITAKQLLRSGVTAARIHLWDLVDGPAFRRQADDNCFPAPRLEIGGPGFIGGAPELARDVVWGVKDAEDIRRKVERVRSAGAQWIAIHDLHKFESGQVEGIVGEARRAGLRVMAAGDDPATIQRALEVGVDSIEYLDRTTAEPYPKELLARMKERGAALFLVPPIGYYHRYLEFRRNAELLDDSILTEFMPAALGVYLLNDLRAQRARPHPTSGARIERSFASLPVKFRQLYDAGLNVVIGTDCGSPANFQVDSIWWELENWRKLGVAPVEAIGAATTRGAALLRMPDAGAIKVGARADFVLYNGSVTSGSFDVRRVRYVAKGGEMFVKEGRWVGP
jgi:imidazolonepropionase-like amidohydrolase